MQSAVTNHIGQFFGINRKIGFELFSDKFKTGKTIMVEDENQKTEQIETFGFEAKIQSNLLRGLATRFSDDGDERNALVFQLDALTIYGLFIDEDNSKAYILFDKKWTELPNLELAKLLLGIEQLNEVLLEFSELRAYDALYKSLLEFIDAAG